MRKFILVVALALGTSASAANWEYAFLTYGQPYLIWNTPAKQTAVNSGLFKDLLPKLSCKGGGWLEFFNCVGRQGWEFVNSQQLSPSSEDVTYVFKRQLK